jgi:hypothetical protein
MEDKTVVQELIRIVQQMNSGIYTKSSAAVLITRDAATGILTFTYPGVSTEEGQQLFADAAEIRGFVHKEATDARA